MYLGGECIVLQSLFTKLPNLLINIIKVRVILLLCVVAWFDFYWSPYSFFTNYLLIFLSKHRN